MGEFRMPPGQRPSVRFYPISVLGKPKDVNIEKYMVRITGLVENPREILLKDIFNMPKETKEFDIHCVDGWSYLGGKFGGIYPKVLFEGMKIQSNGKFVMIKCLDGYSTDLPLDFFLSIDAFLAYEMDGRALDIGNGYPLRLVVNGKYAYKDAKWPIEFEIVDRDLPGFWEKKGYSRNADVYKNERFENG